MKDSNDKLKKLFSDFEPEAEDAAIQQGWEKVSYFLPQEKKRRGFIFWTYAGLAAALVVLLPFGWYFYQSGAAVPVVETKQQPGEAAKPVPSFKAQHGTNTSIKPSGGSGDKNSSSNPVVKARLKTPGQQEQTQQEQITANTKTGSVPESSNATITQSTGVIPAPGKVKQDVDEGPDAASPNTTNETEKKIIAGTKPVIAGQGSMQTPPVAEETPATEPIFFLPMKEFVSVVETDSTVKTTVMPLFGIHPKAKEQFMLQLFGGAAYATTQLYYFKYAGREQYNKLQASFGALAAYRFRNKVSVIAQFMLTQNSNTTYTHSLVENQAVPKTGGPIISLIPDSVQQYAKTYTDTKLQFSPAYNLALGFGYPMWKNNRTEISASLLMNVNFAGYSFEETHTRGAETFTYVAGPSSSPPSITAGMLPANVKFKAQVTSLGLMPGITVGYRLYRNIALIARPSFLVQMTEKNNVVKGLFNIKQNTAYLHAGVQISW